MRNPSTPAVHWVTHAPEATIKALRFSDRVLGDLDRAALTAVPGHLADVDAIAADLRERVRALKHEHLERTESVSPGAVAHLRMSGLRVLCLHLSWICATLGMAFYWTRSSIDPRGVIGWTAGLLVASLLLCMAAHLPLRRSRPPFSGVVFLSWLTVAIAVAGMLPAHAYLSILDATEAHGIALAVGWTSVALLAVLAGAVTRARRRLTRAERETQDREVAGFRGRLGAETTAALAAAGEQVRSLWADVPEADRIRVIADLAAAHELLVERRAVEPDTTTEVPGLRYLDSQALTEAARIGAEGVVPLTATGWKRSTSVRG